MQSAQSGPPGSMAMSGSPGVGVSSVGLDALLNNPMFAGGIGLAGLGAAAALARRGIIQGAQMLRRTMLVSVEISRRDPSYAWVLAWLSQPRRPVGLLASRLTRIRNLSVATITKSPVPGGKGGDLSAPGGGAGGTDSGPVPGASFFLQPGYGRHVVRHTDGTYIAVSREKLSTASLSTGEPHETVTLTTLWSRRGVFEDIFAQAHALARSAHEGKTAVYTIQGQSWVELGAARRKRPLQSVVLERGLAEGIVADAKDFLSRHQWYADRGIPYRRTYLLHGPPGGGKSSFIHALAGELDYGLAIVNLVERGLTDDKLAHMLMRLPRHCILLLEDVDVAFANRTQRSPDGYNGPTVTFSGLLNVLDGLAAGEDRIAFLTTNHIERLDAALIRPGRVDVRVRIGEATRDQAAELWDRFYGDVDSTGRGRERFLGRLGELGLVLPPVVAGHDPAAAPVRPVSTAAIQGLFLAHKEDMESAIANLERELAPDHSGRAAHNEASTRTITKHSDRPVG